MIKNNLTLKEVFTSAYQNHLKNNLKLAENLYKKVLEINPNHLESIFLLGTLSIQTKNFNVAVKLLKKATLLKPDYADAFHNLGFTFIEMGDLKQGVQFFNKTIEINPKHKDVHYNLGNAMKQLGEFKKSRDCYKKAIEVEPKNSQAHNNLGNIYKQLGEFQKAIDSYNTAIQVKPNNSNAHYNLGNIYKQLGEFKKAKDSYQNSLLHDPSNLEAVYNLSEINDEILDENLKDKLFTVAKDKTITKKNIAYKNFLLAKYESKKKNYEKEFNYLLEGHINYFDARKKIFEKGVNYWLQVLPKLIELENIDLPSVSNKKENYKIKPIFIVGVPRCGSTLVEKIIASGEKYMAIGEETGIVSYVVGEKVNKKESIVLDIENFKKEVINNYEEWGLLKKKYDYTFTDKSLDNFFFIGLIKIIFPFAKIINCKRNPLSAIMSIIKNNLGQVSWAHNLENIFKFFDIYHKKIETFKKMYPNYIYELQYEDLVVDPVSESKKLMKFCEIPWNKKCLEYYKRKDMVSHTASTMQIRKPIYVDSFKKHIHYKKFLDKYGKKYSWFN